MVITSLVHGYWSDPIFMESSNLCAHAVETKISSKIFTHTMETLTICHIYRIYHKNRTCMRVCVSTWSSGWARFLCYLYELFTLFSWSIYAICAKNRTIIYGVYPTRGLGCWTRGLTDARWRGWPGAHRRGIWVVAPLRCGPTMS